MADEQSYKKKMESQLNELGAQIQELLHKVGSEVDKEVEALRPKLKAAQEKLDELKHLECAPSTGEFSRPSEYTPIGIAIR